jgi:hypothetical protein
VSCLLRAPTSFAQGGGTVGVQPAGPVDVTILRTVNLPWQQPEVILKTLQPVDSLHVEIVVDAAQGPAHDLWHLPDGATRSLGWQAAPGRHRCDVRVTGMSAGGNFRQVFSAVVDVVAPLEVKLAAQDVNLPARSLQLHAGSELSFAELTIYDVDGHVLHQASTSFAKDAHGRGYELSWPELPTSAAKIVVRAFNTSDTWADLEWAPIQIEVPHEPIYVGDDKPADGERSKFAGAYHEVLQALRAHGAVPGLRLYVLGLTRSQASAGPAADRARELAAYFQQRGGIELPILSAGAVETDEDSASHGHVQAFLALQDPAQAQWTEQRAERRTKH